jgi:hypothetical protein
MNPLPDKVKTYLKKYASKKWSIEPESGELYKNIIVIPSIAEHENLKKCVLSLADNDKKYFNSTLVIIVVNNTPGALEDIKDNNRQTIEFLTNIINGNKNDKAALKIRSSGLNIAFINAAGTGLELSEKEGGVGLARKTGMDLSLTKFNYSIPGKNIIVCLDADCTVSKNYITEITGYFNKYFVSAASINFEHPVNGEGKETEAVICYEIFLRYYVAGLLYASSPYAFQTIGSAMVCDAESYIKNEGMNKKKAAEDFYFLEKLSKNYKIDFIKDAYVYPSGRSSLRVPFGTGQRITRFLSGSKNEYVLNDPRSFGILKEWLDIFMNVENKDPFEYLEQAALIHDELKNFLSDRNFIDDMKNIIANSAGNEQFTRQKMRWFDGFKTLKLIHHLRDTAFPEINMFDALDKLFIMTGTDPGIKRSDDIPPVNIQKEYLFYLRKSEYNRYTV